ncbi:patatin [Sulfurihydrogenibium azorense Az-Fu1]|uniref:Patatin n=1 Tax=Sulfurihydrogenibium azorense (strain DSM 15241 / OCM 825 / Az-Fu1) TaxID=204536 RepID=C1DVC2_SULAA|nr:patatin-like phospholipase family protein [Sulfurihydrogenibium azorense]ACN98846.1 patatin [Sulfurihydrogenibium azorense Az-Fu1]
MKIGLVLSGGAVRGLAHVGVLKALEEKGIKPDFVSGVSAGSIVGVFYCSGYTPKEMEEIALKTNFTTMIKPSLSKKAFFSLDSIEDFLKKYIHHKKLEELKIPFYVTVTNLNTANVDFFSEGDLIKIIKASCSIPVMFKPVKIGEYYYVDGGIMNNLPVEPLLDKTQYIIGSEVNPFLPEEKDFSNVISIGIRSFYLAVRSNIESRKNYCNLFIQPPDLVKIPLFATWKSKEAIDIGYNYTKNLLKDLNL